MPSNKTTVLISDQYYVVRLGVKAALARDRSLRVVGEAENGRDAVRLAKRLKPDVVISGISMPLLNGLEAARQILEHKGTRVIILSAQADDKYIERAMRVKVSGYLLKSTALDTLPLAVRAVAAGRTAFSPAIISHLKRHGKVPGYAEHEENGLTPREVQVIQLVTEEKLNKEIGDYLGIGESRVKKLVDHVMRKVGVNSRVGIAHYGKSAGHSQGRLN